MMNKMPWTTECLLFEERREEFAAAQRRLDTRTFPYEVVSSNFLRRWYIVGSELN